MLSRTTDRFVIADLGRAAGSQDPLLQTIANDGNLAVISVGYRLAPEHPFPAGPQDCFDAVDWLVRNSREYFGKEMLFIGGEVCFKPLFPPVVSGTI
jgi:acetyl esterase/lipase